MRPGGQTIGFRRLPAPRGGWQTTEHDGLPNVLPFASARALRDNPGMHFAYSPKVQELQQKLTAFMDKHIYPNEPLYYRPPGRALQRHRSFEIPARRQ